MMINILRAAVFFAFTASTAVSFQAALPHRSSKAVTTRTTTTTATTATTSTTLQMNFIRNLLGLGERSYPAPCVMGDETIMSQKSHGTSETPVQSSLRWQCDSQLADKICNFNRHGAERLGYWMGTSFLDEAKEEYEEKGQITFYDSNTGKPLFVAPQGRTFDEFVMESMSHGWPSFRDEEVVWENVRCLSDGEAVSLDGTHLGHNLPDWSGSNRYCINLVSVAGQPVDEQE